MLQRTAVLAVLAIVLAGCSGSSTPSGDDDEGTGAGFDDLDLKATDSTGVIRGLVVDDRIVPVEAAIVELRAPSGVETQESDAEGRFGFEDLAPGTYFLSISKLNYLAVQTTAEVQAGIDEPPVQRVLLTRLFDVEPYSELIKFEGFLACSNGYFVGTTCVNDYTRLVPQCNGGCLQDYNLSQTAGNNREYVTSMTGGWQTMIWELVWEPTTSGSSAALATLVSYFARPSASHFYGQASGESPVTLRLELNETGPGQNLDPTLIPPEGIPDLFTFFNASGSIAINQDFTSYHFTFYYGKPPEDWSFVGGDEIPF